MMTSKLHRQRACQLAIDRALALEPFVIHRWCVDPARIGRVKSRRCSMNRSTTGLNVRFFSMRTATGHGRSGNSIGNTFSERRFELRRKNELGIAVRNGLVAIKLNRRPTEKVTKLIFGIFKPFAWKASTTV